jgi:hypothetical protein
MDIAANTQLVRKYTPQLIAHTYQSIQTIVTPAVEQRNGRIWNWKVMVA